MIIIIRGKIGKLERYVLYFLKVKIILEQKKVVMWTFKMERIEYLIIFFDYKIVIFLLKKKDQTYFW